MPRSPHPNGLFPPPFPDCFEVKGLEPNHPAPSLSPTEQTRNHCLPQWLPIYLPLSDRHSMALLKNAGSLIAHGFCSRAHIPEQSLPLNCRPPHTGQRLPLDPSVHLERLDST